MAMLANMYEAGEGVVPDWERSLEWARRAIAAGSVTALLNLGISYRRRGDRSAAMDCFQQAADRGDGEAALELADLLPPGQAERPRTIELLQRVLASSSVSPDSLERARALLEDLTRD
ncbi:tetratricopeptide repeat protein [Roseateles sp. L2-2]|uniref:tetratricopeptide repeat protein n=1 Tax=Roseateles sp. L2-2 TaxID=3422597 RepID=UPI003D359F49